MLTSRRAHGTTNGRRSSNAALKRYFSSPTSSEPQRGASRRRLATALRRAGLIDFDDLVIFGNRLVSDHDWVLPAIQARWPVLAVYTVCALLGATAIGWNGVFLAEVARLAPAGRVPEATGAVLTASCTGLVLGPLLIAGVAQLASLAASYAVLAAFTLLATLPLLRPQP